MLEDVIGKFQETTKNVEDLLEQIEIVKQNGISDALKIVNDASKQMSVQEKIFEIDKAIKKIEDIKKIKTLYISFQKNSQHKIQNIQNLLQDKLKIIVVDNHLKNFLMKQNITTVDEVKKDEVLNRLIDNNTVFISENLPKNLRNDNDKYISYLLDYEDADEVLPACASIVHELHSQLWSGSIDE